MTQIEDREKAAKVLAQNEELNKKLLEFSKDMDLIRLNQDLSAKEKATALKQVSIKMQKLAEKI